MDVEKSVEELLRKYRFNKERVGYLEKRLKWITPEAHEDYIEYKMYAAGESGSTVKFIIEDGQETAKLNKVEETAVEYRKRCREEYINAKKTTQRELRKLRYDTVIVEEGLELLGRINQKYQLIAEKYYIHNQRMEDIADCIHVSRSRCYELCKNALKLLIRVLYGDSVP